MQAYRLVPGRERSRLECFEPTPRPLAARELRLRMRAVSLNYRDLMIARGSYLATGVPERIPCSDGAGEVIAVGAQVTRFQPGDRVVGSFFPDWIDGAPTPATTARAPGGSVDGMLAEEVIVHEDAAVSIPAHLDFIEAATLPCAGVTAWNTLFVAGALRPGASVLMLGTGGVSIWALQLARAAGLRSFITSGSDDKLARARALGADETINYRSTPEWQDEVRRRSGGQGVDLVVEVGGQGTLKRSVAATRMGGTVAIIGGVTGFGGELEPLALIGGARRLCGIFVGSRTMLEDLARFVSLAGIRPVVDRVFPFAEAPEAYAWLEAAGHFGKVVIGMGEGGS